MVVKLAHYFTRMLKIGVLISDLERGLDETTIKAITRQMTEVIGEFKADCFLCFQAYLCLIKFFLY